MTQPTYDNPFKSPTVLEQIPRPRSERQPWVDHDQMPGLVALTWMLFIFSATVHSMAALYFGSAEWGLAALLSAGAGFVVLYPSVLAWGLGLGYAFLMATICFCANAATYIEPRTGFFDIPPLLMYLGIMGLMLMTSRYYVFGAAHAERRDETSEEDG